MFLFLVITSLFQKPIKGLKESKLFLILVDEASDCSNQEQLSFVLSFVDKDIEIREEFLGFQHCELGLSRKTLAETILTEIGNPYFTLICL